MNEPIDTAALREAGEYCTDVAGEFPPLPRKPIRVLVAPRVTVDHGARAAYIHLSSNPCSARQVEVQRNVVLDFDADGHLIGIELLAPTDEGLQALEQLGGGGWC